MPFAVAQQTVHTVFGDRPANTTSDLQKSITQCAYTWEVPGGKSSVTFNSDGTGRQTFFNFTWRAKNAQEIELTMAGSTGKAEIRFSNDYTSFTGTDFDGSRAIHGSVVAPQAPAQAPIPAQATPPPAAAAVTPAAGNTNPFLTDDLSRGGSGTADSTDALQKAIIGQKFTWEHETGTNLEVVLFAADGKGQQSFFEIAWRAKNAHEIELSIPDKRSPGKILLRFNSDYTKYTATDFNGEPLKGHKVLPK
jgi:hypothetical protein